MFLQNTWYVACTGDEVQDKPLGRRICGQSIVFYRGKENTVAALEDFCPHRGAALSLGSVCEGNLMCGYHGLVMGADGKAVSMPMQRVAGFPCIKSYAVIERYGFIWLWPGDPERADDTLIPHLDWAVNPERSEEHTSELQSLMRISYAVFCLKKKIHIRIKNRTHK